jgi:hypothetical protein
MPPALGMRPPSMIGALDGFSPPMPFPVSPGILKPRTSRENRGHPKPGMRVAATTPFAAPSDPECRRNARKTPEIPVEKAIPDFLPTYFLTPCSGATSLSLRNENRGRILP